MILKFESGGIPFVEYTPLNFNTASNYGSVSEESKTKRDSSDSKESGKLTEKDLLMAIKDLDALPSDSAQLYDLMVDFVRMWEMGVGDADPSMLATQFIRMLQHMKDSVYRKGAFEEAYKNVKENNGLNEYAVTDTGDIVVASSDGGIKFASIEQVLSGEYKPLTNADLLRLRAESYAGNDTLTQIVSNGIGMEKIVLLINLAMHNLGSSLEAYEGLSRDPFLQATVEAMRELLNKINTINSSASSDEEKQKAISELLAAALASLSQRYSGATELGLYKYTESDKNSNKLLEYALNYIYNVLPKNARTILDLHSGGNGKMMIGSLLASTATTEHSLKWDMLENANGTKPGTKESENGGNSGLYINLVKGTGEAGVTNFLILDSDGFSFTVNGKSYPYIQDQQGNIIETCSLALAMQKGIPYKGGDYAITFGETPLDGVALQNVLFEADGSTMRVILPVKEEAGKIVPDLEVAKEHANLINLINKKGFKDLEVQRELQKSGLFRENGQINPAKFLVYLIANGKTTSRVITPDAWALEFDASQEDEDLMNKHLASEVDRLDLGEFWINTPWFNDTFYKGVIYIPLTENELNAGTNLKLHFSDSVAKNMENNYLIGEGWRNLNSTNIDDD